MYLPRQRATMYPKSFGNKRVIMDFGFKNMLDIAQMTKEFCQDNFTIPDYLFDYVHGKSQSNSPPWEGCTHLYIPVLANAHWFAVEMNFAESTLYVYDPDKSCLTQGQLEKFLESVCYFIPLLAKSVNISVEDKVQVQRVDDTVKQKIS
ncbi:Ulp1 protease family protein [Abeliophyllum distichum]|uniref:Ulp1 protease family protein n=1 Tax=Abeliophyllum distichum TaxID=126358 RepID=A0ABD1PFP5_9LAMI